AVLLEIGSHRNGSATISDAAIITLAATTHVFNERPLSIRAATGAATGLTIIASAHVKTENRKQKTEMETRRLGCGVSQSPLVYVFCFLFFGFALSAQTNPAASSAMPITSWWPDPAISIIGSGC